MPNPDNSISLQTLSLPTGKPDSALWRLFTASELIHPQLGLAWLENLSTHALDKGDQPLIVIARRSDEDLVALPVVIRQRRAMALSTFYTSLYQPLVQSDNPEPLLQAVFKYLAKDKRCSHLTLMPLDRTTAETQLLLDAQEKAGWRGVHMYFCFGNWIHDTNGQTYDNYLASRPSKLRNTIRRKQQKFVPGSKGELSLITGSHELDTGIDQFNTVYRNSWKMEEPYPDFIPALVRLAAARGWLRLGIATYNTLPVAAQIWLIHNGTAYIYKLAYDDNFKSLSPGTVLTAFMFENVMNNDNVTRIDYLSGDDVYKRDWMSTRRERHGIAAYNPATFRGFFDLALHRLKALVRRKAKQNSD